MPRGVFGVNSDVWDGACCEIIIAKPSILGVWRGSEYAYAHNI